MNTFALATLGCKVNQYDGDDIRQRLRGYRQVDFSEAADLYIVNTCGVTAEAEAKARQLLRRAKRTKPNAFLVLTGCYRPEDQERLRALGVDLFVSNTQKARLPELLEHERFGTGVGNSARDETAVPDMRTARSGQERTRAFVKVQDGCDQRCSYCAIPDFRGTPTSRTIDKVIDEVRGLSVAGVPEAVLTGIHLGNYGLDLEGTPDLALLTAVLLRETGIPRLRLSSLEPQEVTDDLIELMSAEKRLARHFHLPLQSGSDRILERMNRPYDSAGFRETVSRVKRMIPDIGLTTDVMVGFPGESNTDFEETLELIESCGFSRLHVFKFSPRPWTPAAAMPETVAETERSSRAARTRELGGRLGAKFGASFVGKRVEVVVEPPKAGAQTGLTGEYLRVEFNQPVAPAGRICHVWVERSENGFLEGRIQDE